jgi:hypothetical protein
MASVFADWRCVLRVRSLFSQAWVTFSALPFLRNHLVVSFLLRSLRSFAAIRALPFFAHFVPFRGIPLFWGRVGKMCEGLPAGEKRTGNFLSLP